MSRSKFVPVVALTPRISTRYLLVVIIIIAIVAGSSFIYFEIIQNPSVSPSNKSTYQAYGFSIQYTTGATMQLGIGGLNSTHGAIFWYWNYGGREFSVQWDNASSNNVNTGHVLTAFNATLINTGNTTINGLSWNYLTFHYTFHSVLYYETYADRFFQSEQKIYILTFFDLTNDTLAQLNTWGTTFNG